MGSGPSVINLPVEKRVKLIEGLNKPLPPDFEKNATIVDSIFGITPETFDSVVKSIRDNGKEGEEYFMNAAKYALGLLPRKVDLLKSLLKEFNCELEDKKQWYELIGDEFKHLLDDDAEKFNPKNFENCFIYSPIYPSVLLFADGMCSLTGSVNCFKKNYIRSTYGDLHSQQLKNAIAGNCEEIIDYVKKDDSFDNCLSAAVISHNYKICETLLKDFKCEGITPSFPLLCFNDKVFYSFIKQDIYGSKFLDEAFVNALKIKNYVAVRFIINEILPNHELLDSAKGEILLKLYESGLVSEMYTVIEKCKVSFKSKKISRKILYAVIANNDFDNTKLLVEKHKAKLDPFCLQIACKSGFIDIVKYLVENHNLNPNSSKHSSDDSPFIAACSNNRKDVVRYLFEHCEINMNSHDFYGMYPIMFFTDYELDFFKKAAEKYPKCIKQVYDKNSELGILSCAAKYGNFEVVKYIIEELKFNPKKANQYGHNTLYFAVQGPSVETIKYLLDKDPDEMKPERIGNYLIIASYGNNINTIKFLIEECHADVNFKGKNGRTAVLNTVNNTKIFHYLTVDCKADIGTTDNSRNILLNEVVRIGNLDVLKILREELNVEITSDGYGEKFLLSAMTHKNLDFVKYMFEEVNFIPKELPYVDTSDEITKYMNEKRK